MNEERIAHALGWFSIGLGLTEVLSGGRLGQALGMEERTGLLRAFGLREIVTGMGILSQPRPTAWVWGRVGGDVMDLAALCAACEPENPQRANVMAAIGTVAGVTAIDLWCAWRLTTRTYLRSNRNGVLPLWRRAASQLVQYTKR